MNDTAEIIDLNVTRGDDISFLVTAHDSVTKENLLVNGVKLWFTIKTSYEDSDDDAVYTKPYSVTATVDSIAVGVDHTEKLIPLGDYYYDVQMKTSTGKIKTIIKGRLSVTYDVTNRYE